MVGDGATAMTNGVGGKRATGGENGPAGERIPIAEAHEKNRSKSDSPSAPRNRATSKWRRYRLAFWTALAAVLLGAVGYVLYFLLPAGSEVATPAYTAIVFTTTAHYDNVSFEVFQVQPSTETVVVEASASDKIVHTTSSLSLYLPHGVKFESCGSNCNNHSYYPTATQDLTFKGKVASASFTVNSNHLAWISDQTDATAVLPDLTYRGPGTPQFFVYYPIAGATGYDWNSLPAAFSSKKQVGWGEPIVNGHAPEKVATGVNHNAQRTIANLTFLAGALVGAAAGGIIGAFQEALRAHYEKVNA